MLFSIVVFCSWNFGSFCFLLNARVVGFFKAKPREFHWFKETLWPRRLPGDGDMDIVAMVVVVVVVVVVDAVDAVVVVIMIIVEILGLGFGSK